MMIACPRCGNTNPKLSIKEIEMMDGPRTVKGTAFMCIFCPHVFSVSVDSTVSRNDTISEVKVLMRRSKPRRVRRRGLSR